VLNILLTVMLVGLITGVIVGSVFAIYIKNNIDPSLDTSLLIEKNGKWWFGVDGKPYCDVWDERSGMYEFDLPAKTAMRLSVDELILANSCGGVNHWVEVD